jgi:hypothetical protein
MGSHRCVSSAGESGAAATRTSAREEVARFRCSARGGARSRLRMAELQHGDQGGGMALCGCFINGTGDYSGVVTTVTERGWQREAGPVVVFGEVA